MPWASPPGGALTEHKVGTRYVQSRTAAGGWSQQRFARRPGPSRADGLVGAAAEHAVRLLTGIRPRGLVLGGDKALAASLLDDDRQGLRHLPRRELYDLPDPRLDVLQKALDRGTAVRITIEE